MHDQHVCIQGLYIYLAIYSLIRNITDKICLTYISNPVSHIFIMLSRIAKAIMHPSLKGKRNLYIKASGDDPTIWYAKSNAFPMHTVQEKHLTSCVYPRTCIFQPASMMLSWSSSPCQTIKPLYSRGIKNVSPFRKKGTWIVISRQCYPLYTCMKTSATYFKISILNVPM